MVNDLMWQVFNHDGNVYNAYVRDMVTPDPVHDVVVKIE